MASLTIRKLSEDTKRRLRVRAAEHGRSMEEEARMILRDAVAETPPRQDHLVDYIRALVEPFGGVDLELPPRDAMREPPDFG